MKLCTTYSMLNVVGPTDGFPSKSSKYHVLVLRARRIHSKSDPSFLYRLRRLHLYRSGTVTIPYEVIADNTAITASPIAEFL